MTVHSPTQKSYFFTSHGDRVALPTSPTIRQRYQGIIYSIKHVESGEEYIGKTTTAFSSRMHSHVYHANHPEKLAGQRKLAAALRRSPTKFSCRILKRNIDIKEIAKWEKKYITTHNPSLNMAGGGGGGVSRNDRGSTKKTKVEILDTPKKKYPVKFIKGKVRVILTPSAKKRRNVIYVFKNEKTGKRLVGRTGQAIRSRVYQYQWCINSEKSDQRNSEFFRDIKTSTQNFTFGVLAKSNTPSNLDNLEEQCIERKESRRNGYNKNKGGGGSSVCRVLNFD